MNEENKNVNEEDIDGVITLVDEDGKEISFEIVGDAEIDGIVYLAVVPAGVLENNEGIIEYSLLKIEVDEEGDEVFSSLDDEDEFDKVACYFDDLFDSEEDYDV